MSQLDRINRLGATQHRERGESSEELGSRRSVSEMKKTRRRYPHSPTHTEILAGPAMTTGHCAAG
jgi:hypothetical protein